MGNAPICGESDISLSNSKHHQPKVESIPLPPIVLKKLLLRSPNPFRDNPEIKKIFDTLQIESEPFLTSSSISQFTQRAFPQENSSQNSVPNLTSINNPSTVVDDEYSEIMQIQSDYDSFTELNPDQNGPSGRKVIYRYINTDSYIIGEFDKNTQSFEGSVKIKSVGGGFEYFGEMKNSLKNGKGILKMKNGEIYKGEFFNNKMIGEGTYYFKKRGIFLKGNIFKGNKVEGDGEYSWVDKKKNKGMAQYKGKIKNGVPHGIGRKINLKNILRNLQME